LIKEIEVGQASRAFVDQAALIYSYSHSSERPAALAISSERAFYDLNAVARGRTRVLLVQSGQSGRALCVLGAKHRHTATTVRCALHVAGSLNERELTALVDRSVQRMRNLGRSRMHLTFPSGLGSSRFIQMGFEPRSSTIEMWRPLDNVRKSSAKFDDDIKFIGFLERVPVEFAAECCELKSTLGNSVRGDRRSDPTEVDIAELRFQEEAAIARGTPPLGLIGLEPVTRRIVGIADFIRGSPNAACVMHQDTVIAPTHQGRGLGARLKQAALVWLAKTLPEARYVWTRNNELNERIVAVNRRLEYQEAARLPWMEYSEGS
jgi:GNAT superfamily N-acetyltransferase